MRYDLKLDPTYFNENLSPIFSGHSTVQRATTIQGQTNIDTGAFSSGNVHRPWAGLTIVEPLTNSFWLVTNESFNKSQPFVI